MSLPQFPKPDTILCRDKALDAILTSIAMEEVALSHIINAEGEKIQHVIKSAKENKADICDVLKVNDSAASMLEQVNDMQIILKNKLRLALKYLPKPEEPTCSKPKPPCPQPKPPYPQPKPPYPQPKPPCPQPKPPCPQPKPPCPQPKPPRPTPQPCPKPKPPRPKPQPCPKPKPPRPTPKPCSCHRPKPCSCHVHNQDFFTNFDLCYIKTCDCCHCRNNKKF